MRRTLTLEEFATRCSAVPDLELSWVYWNWLLPTTTGYALWLLFVRPALNGVLVALRAAGAAGEEPKAAD